LEAKVAIVTGGKRGLGEGNRPRFCSDRSSCCHCNLVIADSQLEAAAEEVRNFVGSPLASQGGVTENADVDNLAKRVVDKFWNVGIPVNDASIYVE
jgi:NAD(P)-dependent dehydrogenase (short-subunit alcohol dehydrogenase family)